MYALCICVKKRFSISNCMSCVLGEVLGKSAVLKPIVFQMTDTSLMNSHFSGYYYYVSTMFTAA